MVVEKAFRGNGSRKVGVIPRMKCTECGLEQTAIGLGAYCTCDDPLYEPEPTPPKPKLTAEKWLALNAERQKEEEARKIQLALEIQRQTEKLRAAEANRIVDKFLERIEDGQDIWGDRGQNPRTPSVSFETNQLVYEQLKSLGFYLESYRHSQHEYSLVVHKP